MSDNEKVICGLQAIVTGLSQQADGHAIQSRIFASQGLTKLAKNEDKKCAPVYTDAVEYLKYDLQVSKDGLKWLAEIVNAAQV